MNNSSRYHFDLLENTFDDEEARQYICKKCGAIMVTDNHTAPERCAICNGRVTLGQRMSGEAAPTLVIPFSVTRKEATKAFYRWRRKLNFSPRDFYKKKHPNKVVGMYLPAWVFQTLCQGKASLRGSTAESFPEGEEIVTEIKEYVLDREGSLQLENLPESASSIFSDKLLHHLEPYDFRQGKVYDTSYLSGYFMEPYGKLPNDCIRRIQERGEAYLDEYMLQSVTDYDSPYIVSRNYEITPKTCQYALLPVWFVYYEYGNEEYVFALNGQTGKLAWNPPLSYPRIATVFAMIGVFLFVFLRIITVLLGGPLL